MAQGPIDRAISGQTRALSAEAAGGPATPSSSITGVGGGGARDLLQLLSSGGIGAEKLMALLQLIAGLGGPLAPQQGAPQQPIPQQPAPPQGAAGPIERALR